METSSLDDWENFFYPFKLHSKAKQLCLRLWYLRFSLPGVWQTLGSALHIYAVMLSHRRAMSDAIRLCSAKLLYHGDECQDSSLKTQGHFFQWHGDACSLKHYFLVAPVEHLHLLVNDWSKMCKCFISVCQNKLFFLSTLPFKDVKHLHKRTHLSYS